jgi:hypothetical protein
MQDSLQFIRELPLYQREQPYELYGYPEEQFESQTNCKFETKYVDAKDCRRHDDVSIEKHGFMFKSHPSACPLDAKYFETVGGDQSVVRQYLEETIELIRETFKPVDVICFDWRVSHLHRHWKLEATSGFHIYHAQKFRRRDPGASAKIPPRDLKDIRNFALPTGDVVHCGKASMLSLPCSLLSSDLM